MTENSSNSSGALGNTINQSPPAKRWCFTLNNYDEKEYMELKQYFSSNNCIFCIGKEIGLNETPHLQGYVNFASKIRLSALKKINNRAHWEKCRGNEQDNLTYCSKDGKFETNAKIARPLKILKDEQLFDWQKEIVNICKSEPHDRKIYWFWDTEGNKGKTALAKYLCHNLGAVIIEGKKSDILFCAAEHESDIYICDFERSMEEFIPYGALEKIKNGLYMSSKYESKPIIRNSPHLICFANFLPDRTKLSKDRWVIKGIKSVPDDNTMLLVKKRDLSHLSFTSL